MPRERINNPDLSVFPTDPDEPHRERAVHVSWHRGCGYVQIALEGDGADWRSTDEWVDRSTKYSPGLTLAEVERLEQALAKAKRQAF